MKTRSRALQLTLATVFGVPALLFGQVGTITGEWRQGDPINNQACMLLTDGRIALNETRSLSADELANRCATGLRLTSKGAFEEPTTIVILIGLKSKARLEGIPLTGWREYWFADTSALTINRVTKFLELGSMETITRVISDTPLWNLKDQGEIDGFKFQVVDGYSVEVELFSGGKSKCLRYSNPDAYEQVENFQFRAALHKLLADLELSSDEFVYGLNELDGAELPTPQKNQAEQGVAPQSATRSESDSEGGDKPQPESEPRPR